MHFEEDFFREEEREGFRISSLMKRTWAAEMEVLQGFDEICMANDIQYYAAYGTLLGAVRHKGFIPWDDDIDIWLFREDAMRLNSLDDEIFNEKGLILFNPYRTPESTNLAWRIDNGRNLMLTQEHLIKYHLCPFHLGIDIFILDNIPDDAEAEKTQDTLLACANTLCREWDNKELSMEEKIATYDELKETIGISLPENLPYKQRLSILSDCIMGMYKNDGKWVACIPDKGSGDNKRVFLPEWFGEGELLDFEHIKLPSPIEAAKVLSTQFGKDYMVPQRLEGSHSYPFFKGQYRELMKLLETNGMECPEFWRLKEPIE